MSRLVISEDSRSEDLASLAIALNEIVRLPVTMRGIKHPGVRVENGMVMDDNYTGPILEEVIRTGKAIRTIPESGAYAGVPVSVAPIMAEGAAVAAIGIGDRVALLYGGYRLSSRDVLISDPLCCGISRLRP